MRKPDKPFMLIDGEFFEPVFEYRQPQKLNKCKYELITNNNVIRMSFVTERYNREDILRRLIKVAHELSKQYIDEVLMTPHYKIFLTETGVREILICSIRHKNFIKKLL